MAVFEAVSPEWRRQLVLCCGDGGTAGTAYSACAGHTAAASFGGCVGGPTRQSGPLWTGKDAPVCVRSRLIPVPGALLAARATPATLTGPGLPSHNEMMLGIGEELRAWFLRNSLVATPSPKQPPRELVQSIVFLEQAGALRPDIRQGLEAWLHNRLHGREGVEAVGTLSSGWSDLRPGSWRRFGAGYKLDRRTNRVPPWPLDRLQLDPVAGSSWRFAVLGVGWAPCGAAARPVRRWQPYPCKGA